MKTVLVVDDSEVVLELVKKSLEGAGYSVITRSKPSGSVAAILRDKPDVVLLDVNMPTLSGDTIAKILGRVGQNPDTLVLLHSSLSIDNLRLKAMATGAHGYIQKTESPTELVRRIEYWMNKSRQGSASRLEAATGSPHASGGAPSSGKFAAAAPVAPSPVETRAAPSSGRIEAASPPTASNASSGRWRAVAPIDPPANPSSGAMAAARAASSGQLKAAPVINQASPPTVSGTPTSRNMRAAKPAFVGDRLPKVLFVDDDWKMLSSYRTMVAGYLDAEFISSSDDAINRLLSDSPPAVVVCDVMMPGLTGADIYRRAVMLDQRWAGRFVFITGAASTPAVAEFLNTLDVRVFHKPISTDRLLDTLKQMTEGQRR
ncbi:MAG: response regulator [Polyangiaceae bacterium]